MDSYKEINKELILCNQELKMQQSIYQKELIIMKNQLMEELERRVVSEKMIKMMLIDNFKNAFKLIDPESSLLDILQDYEGETVQKYHREKQKHTKILQELRTSNSLLRRSSIVMSPTRRSTHSMQLATPENDVELQQEEQDEVHDEVQDMSVEEDLEDFPDKFACITGAIQEEEEEDDDKYDDEDHDDEDHDRNTSTIHQNMSVTEDMNLAAETMSNHVHDKHFLGNSLPPQVLLKTNRRNACYLRRSPLQDVENLESDIPQKQNSAKTQECSHNTINVARRGKQRSLFVNESIESEDDDEAHNPNAAISIKKFSLIEDISLDAKTISNHSHDKNTPLEKSAPSQELFKNKRRNAFYLLRSPLQDVMNLESDVAEKQNSAKIQENDHTNVAVRREKQLSLFSSDSIESVRHMNSQTNLGQNEIEVEQLSIGINSFRETYATSMALSELTSSRFANAPSSTPNSSQLQNISNSDTLQTPQTRASRRCKPKCLAEPNLHSKMRNDESKTLRIRKNSKKKNKK